jgi:hypothetical protein
MDSRLRGNDDNREAVRQCDSATGRQCDRETEAPVALYVSSVQNRRHPRELPAPVKTGGDPVALRSASLELRVARCEWLDASGQKTVVVPASSAGTA